MATKKRRNPWRTKGKGSLRLRKGACVATIDKSGAWSVSGGRIKAHSGRGKTPTEAKRRAAAALNACNRDYDAMAEEAAYQARHEGGFAGFGFIKRLFGKETPDALAEEQIGKASHAYEEALIAAAQERCPAAHKFAQKGADAYEKVPSDSHLSAGVRKSKEKAYDMSGAVHTALRRFCR